MEFVDTHAHIYSHQFDNDRDEVIRRTLESGVTRVFQANVSLASVGPMLELCDQYPDVCFPMIGIHPKNVRENYGEEIERIEDLLRRYKFYAIGEVGLDSYWAKRILKETGIDFMPYQEAAFRKFIQLALEYDLPINIHSRSVTTETYRILEQEHKPNLRGVWHALREHHKPRRLVNWGIKLGIGGLATYTPAVDDAVRKLGLQNIVLETDAPYLVPEPLKKQTKRNESKNIRIIARHIAKVLGTDTEEVAEATTKSATELFAV